MLNENYYKYNSGKEVIKRIIGDRKEVLPNVCYKSNEGDFYFYVNNKGYLHIVEPLCIKMNVFSDGYAMHDYLINEYGSLVFQKWRSCGSQVKTKEEAFKYLHEDFEVVVD